MTHAAAATYAACPSLTCSVTTAAAATADQTAGSCCFACCSGSQSVSSHQLLNGALRLSQHVAPCSAAAAAAARWPCMRTMRATSNLPSPHAPSVLGPAVCAAALFVRRWNGRKAMRPTARKLQQSPKHKGCISNVRAPQYACEGCLAQHSLA